MEVKTTPHIRRTTLSRVGQSQDVPKLQRDSVGNLSHSSYYVPVSRSEQRREAGCTRTENSRFVQARGLSRATVTDSQLAINAIHSSLTQS